jgi:hypothetical protein
MTEAEVRKIVLDVFEAAMLDAIRPAYRGLKPIWATMDFQLDVARMADNLYAYSQQHSEEEPTPQSTTSGLASDEAIAQFAVVVTSLLANRISNVNLFGTQDGNARGRKAGYESASRLILDVADNWQKYRAEYAAEADK